MVKETDGYQNLEGRGSSPTQLILESVLFNFSIDDDDRYR